MLKANPAASGRESDSGANLAVQQFKSASNQSLVVVSDIVCSTFT